MAEQTRPPESDSTESVRPTVDAPPSEESLVAIALAGDATALEQLLLRYYERLLRYLQFRMPADLGRRLGPEDIIQHAYLKAFGAIDSFQPRSGYSFFAWLKRIADNELTDQLRRLNREPLAGAAASPTESDGFGEAVDRLMGDDPTATVLARRNELIRVMQVTLAGLKPDYRQAIELRYLQGLEFDDVAQRMAITDGQLRGLLHRARQALRDEIHRLSHYV